MLLDVRVAPPIPTPARVAGPLRPAYRCRLAASVDEVRAAQRLRFEVFNLELGEGLVRSYADGLDRDGHDNACDHLLVVDETSSRVVGTYRLQSGSTALAAGGYYSEREFDFTPYEPHRDQLIELGRACIDAQHRSFAVLNLLWRGIAAYARGRSARYLVGCSSFAGTSPAAGAAAWRQLQAHAVAPALRTRPQPGFECSVEPSPGRDEPVAIPRLLSAYLALGAQVCGPPAIDHAFGSTDFLTWLDLESPGVAALRRRGRFFAEPAAPSIG